MKKLYNESNHSKIGTRFGYIQNSYLDSSIYNSK